METKDRKEYLDKSTKIDKEIDEKLKKIQELVSAGDEQAKLSKLEHERFKLEQTSEHERFKPLAEKSAKLAAILDGVDTERVRLFKLGYQALDDKRIQYVYTMLDAIGQSED